MSLRASLPQLSNSDQRFPADPQGQEGADLAETSRLTEQGKSHRIVVGSLGLGVVCDTTISRLGSHTATGLGEKVGVNVEAT